MRQLRILGLALLALVFTDAAPAADAAWAPTHSMKLIAPYSAGGTNDFICRLVALKLGARLGQTIVVENRTGANGIVGSDFVAKAPSDGYTLVMGSSASHGINPSLYAKLPYDATRDFTPIGLIATVPLVLVVDAKLPVASVKDLVAYAKARPGQLSVASPGTGSSPHLASQMFRLAAGIEITHIPYKGDLPALQDVMGGQVTMMFANFPSALPFIQSGKLKALAMTGAQRTPAVPNVPTMAEAGVAGVDVSSWYGLMGPGKLPPEVSARLAKETAAVMAEPDVRATIEKIGARPESGDQAQFQAFVASELRKYATVVKAANIKLE